MDSGFSDSGSILLVYKSNAAFPGRTKMDSVEQECGDRYECASIEIPGAKRWDFC